MGGDKYTVVPVPETQPEPVEQTETTEETTTEQGE